MTATKILKRTAKIFLYFVGSIIALLLLIIILLHTGPAKRWITSKAQSYLSDKIKTRVSIGAIDYRLPEWIEIKQVYIEDQQKDTLLYGGKLAVSINVFKLFRGSLEIRKVELDSIRAFVSRSSGDSNFNYQFILNAFASPASSQPVDTSSSSFNIVLKKLTAHQVILHYIDDYGGSHMEAAIDTFGVTVHTFQLDKMKFELEDASSNDVRFTMEMFKTAHQAPPAPAGEGDTASLPLQIAARKLHLQRINVAVRDRDNGLFYGNQLHDLSVEQASINRSARQVDIKRLQLDSSFFAFASPRTTMAKAVDTATSNNGESGWNISLAALSLKNDSIRYDDNTQPVQPEGLDPAHLYIQGLHMEMRDMAYNADGMHAVVNQLAFHEKNGLQLDTTYARLVYNNRQLSTADLYLKTPQSVLKSKLSVQYDSITALTTHPEKTIVSVQLQQTVIAINDLYMVLPIVKKYLEPEKFRNNIIKLNTTISGSLQRLTIPLLNVQGFSGSMIAARATLYNITDLNRLGYDIDVYKGHLERSDLLKLLPDNPYLSQVSSAIDFATHAKGDMKAGTVVWNIGGKDFTLKGQAAIRNLTSSALQYEVQLKQGRVEKGFLLAVLPPDAVPSSIELPQTILLTGTAGGNMNQVASDLILGGSYGILTLKGYLRDFKNPDAASYDLVLGATHFEAGKLLRQDSLLGPVTLQVTARGTGFDYKKMQAAFTLAVDSAMILQYPYQHISLNATLDHGTVSTDGAIGDPNIRLQYNATASLAGDYPDKVNLSLVVDSFQAQPLHLYADTLSTSFKAVLTDGNFAPQQLNFYALIDSIRLNLQNKPYMLDSIMSSASTANGVHTIVFRSPFIDADASGTFDYDQIGASVMQYINRFYTILHQPDTVATAQQIVLSGTFKKNKLLTDMVPGLKYEEVTFHGSYASAAGDSALAFHLEAPRFVYNTYSLSKATADLTSFNGQLQYKLGADAVSLNDKFFYGSAISGTLMHDSITLSALTKDEHYKDWYGISAALVHRDSIYTLSLTDNLLLNYRSWSVPSDNQIAYSPKGILVNDFLLGNRQSVFSINSQEKAFNSPVDVSIDSFDIKDISSILGTDTLLASGIINGKITVSALDKQLPSFDGNVQIRELGFMRHPVGDVTLTAQELNEDEVKASMTVEGHGNSLALQGVYYLNKVNDQLDLKLDIHRLNLQTMEAFSLRNMSRSSGALTGNIAIKGSLAAPRWEGALHFDSVHFTVVHTGAAYTIDNQTIGLHYPDVSFRHFTIRDSANRPLDINGNISARSMSLYDLDMQVKASNFSVLNTNRAIGNQVYGHAAISTNITVSGTSDAPDIEGDISLNKNSMVTMVLPEENIDRDAALSVVRFVDLDTISLQPKPGFVPASVAAGNGGQFLNYNLNIHVDKTASLTVVIDPSTGDELNVQGDAQLNAGVDPGGNIVLAGTYNLHSGYYIMNYEFIQKKFNLLDSSSLTFYGSPMDARVNITAEYIANTAPGDLLANEVAGMDAKTAAAFNQKIPFRVLLYLKGNIKKPEISFDIQMPDESKNLPISNEVRSTIENKLAQVRADEAVKNKEVFALLLFGRFVGEQSTDFFAGSGTSNNEVIRESVSSFLSTALNQAASNLIKGVDVNVNLNSYQDYSTGSEQDRTDLNVAVSKNFLNDRLTVTAGENFGIDGQDANQRVAQQNPSAVPDITVNYKLSSSGRYVIRAYKKDQFEAMLDGYITQTGVGFILSLDYDRLNELFRKKKKEPHKQRTGHE